MSYEDPLVGFHFQLSVGGGVIEGFFTECSGIGSEHEVIEHKVVSEGTKEIVMKIPGRLKWENVVLKRGITSTMDIWSWRKEIEDGNVDGNRYDGSIMMLDQSGSVVAQWDFLRAWPMKVSGPAPKADGNEIGVEEMTLTHEYIERVQ